MVRLVIAIVAALALAGCATQLQPLPGAESTVKASWYGGGERLSAHTSTGERFNPLARTCASSNHRVRQARRGHLSRSLDNLPRQ